MGETMRIKPCPCHKRNCRHERFMWRLACERFPDAAAEQDFPRFMRYARRVKGVQMSAKEMRTMLAEMDAPEQVTP